MRQPTFFLTHGAGPCFWVDLPLPFGRGAYDGLARHFEELLGTLSVRPKAVLVVSAHWEAYSPTLSTAASPGMLFDYQGFPSQAYQLNYPAAGSPEVARREQADVELRRPDAARALRLAAPDGDAPADRAGIR